MNMKMSGMIMATVAAGLFLGGCETPAANSGSQVAMIHCDGVNSCKGTGSCKGAKNDCKGLNSCKGQGFLSLTPSECDAAKAKATA